MCNGCSSYKFKLFPGCTDGDIRLAEGDTLAEGRVELCRNDIWGTVCRNGMDIEDARVVCRQLGFSTAGRFTHLAVVNLILSLHMAL